MAFTLSRSGSSSWLVVILLVGTVQAARPSEPTLEPIVVTASREPRTIESSPASISVITREEIEAKRYPDVLEALREIPGVHMDQPGARGSVSSIYLRGLDPNHTLVMVDGVRLNDTTNNRGGSYDFSTLGMENVERIEIVRGPLSAVYGSDAIGGAINIITRRGSEARETQLDLSGGRFGNHRAMAGTWGRLGQADYSITGSYLNEGNFPHDARFSDWNIKSALGIRLPSDSELRGTLRFVNAQAKAFPDDSGGPEFAVIRELDKRSIREFSAGLEFVQRPIPWLDYSLKTSYYRRSEDRDSPGIAPGVRDPFGIPGDLSRDVLNRYAFVAKTTTKIWDRFSLTAGGDFYRDSGSSQSELLFGGFPVPASFELSRSVGGPFAEGSWECSCGLVFQTGVRGDFATGSSPEVTPRVGASYHVPGSEIVLSANWGEGFKLPSFFSLANPIVGNINLQPEHSRGFDAGIRYSFWSRRVTMNVTYFDNSVKDLIDFEPGPPPRLVNRSNVISQGVEFALQARPLNSLSLKGQLTYNHQDIRGSPEPLLNRPSWQGGFSINWEPVEKWQFTLRALFVGKVLDSSVPTGQVTLSPYHRFDMALSWRVFKSVALSLAIDNLSNAKYEEAVGFPAVSIRPRLGLELKM